VSDLCDWVEWEPNLTGVLDLLSEIAASFPIERVPNLIWKVVGETDSQESRSALTLQLAQQRLDGNIFTDIAEKILSRCGANETWVLSALRIFENHQMGNNAGIVFLEKMIAELPTSFCRAREKVVALLLDTLGRRVASLCERPVWEKLCLPDGLPKLINE
jgi:hypothetical protein